MSTMLAAFKLKPFDLDPIYASWTSAPVFVGNPKKDGPVDQWLEAIKAGCLEHKVPKDLWHVVGQHYMGEKARERLYEVKKVMLNLHGGKFKWNWKRFKVAMRNMSWDIDAKRTLPFRVGSLSSGIWWIIGKADTEAAPAPPSAPSKEPFLTRTLKSFPHGRSTSESSTDEPSSPPPKKSFFASSGGPPPTLKKDPKPADTTPKRSASVKETPSGPTKRKSLMHMPKPTDDATLRISHAPVWLLTACQSLESLNDEHPKVMSTLAAVLITVGSVPALPAVSAGAAGAFLASSTAHALGSIAVGLGTWIGAQREGLIQVS